MIEIVPLENAVRVMLRCDGHGCIRCDPPLELRTAGEMLAVLECAQVLGWRISPFASDLCPSCSGSEPPAKPKAELQ